MKKEISTEEYKQYFNQLIGLPIIDIFKAAGTELFFVFKDKKEDELNFTIDGVWNYDSDNYLFMSEFQDDKESALQLYERITLFINQKLKNKVKTVIEFKFSKTARTVTIAFDDQSTLNVIPNRFGLISLSCHRKKEIVLANQSDNCQIIFVKEIN